MKKYKLLRQSKKVSAVVLAASVMMTSIAPESIVYASDTEVETAAQSEEDPAQAVAEQEADPDAGKKHSR